MTTPVIDPGPPPPVPPLPPVSPGAPGAVPARRPGVRERFFSWTAGLGVVRGDGWIGGVAAGLAARMRIDPLIVRGILVVIGLFGFPALFLYAIAWALLPDLDGRIPLQEALRGRFTSALIGIAACAVLGLLPASLALFVAAPTLWSVAGAGGAITALSILCLVVGVIAVVALVLLIVRAARRTPRGLATPEAGAAVGWAAAAPGESAPTGSGPVAHADGQGTDAAGFAASVPADSVVAPAEPEPSSADQADEPERPDPEPADAAYAAWREQHAAWKAQDDAWRRQQQDAARVAREQARRERQERATAFSAEAAERRRIRRLTKPRTPFAYVAVVVGLAAIAGALAALQQGGETAPALGLFVGALVLAGGMVAAGILRRRSGFLASTTALALAGGLVALAVPTMVALHVGSYGISNTDQSPAFPASAPFVQPWGDLTIYLADTGRDGEMYVRKRAGSTFVTLDARVALELDVTTRSGWVTLAGTDREQVYLPDQPGVVTQVLPDGRIRYTATISPEGTVTTRQKLVIAQDSGPIDLYVQTMTDAPADREDPVATPIPTPTPSPSPEGDQG
ncbi:PspC domain-containing protein [Microbacterium sp.]|uniref:PspC domain-containing protein n=1 Tax=Microbacterium sp. TaxID=51671 RepID=UPI0039E35E0D